MLILSTNSLCKLSVLVLSWLIFFPATKTQKHEGSLKTTNNGNLSCTQLVRPKSSRDRYESNARFTKEDRALFVSQSRYVYKKI